MTSPYHPKSITGRTLTIQYPSFVVASCLHRRRFLISLSSPITLFSPIHGIIFIITPSPRLSALARITIIPFHDVLCLVHDVLRPFHHDLGQILYTNPVSCRTRYFTIALSIRYGLVVKFHCRFTRFPLFRPCSLLLRRPTSSSSTKIPSSQLKQTKQRR
ncbi:hypothetical protein C8J56DRAFT_1064354 [Mycena floridula]|nr:hypothetical protein C8J56DRAFT_1064354 [Mycena floridula]